MVVESLCSSSKERENFSPAETTISVSRLPLSESKSLSSALPTMSSVILPASSGSRAKPSGAKVLTTSPIR